MWSDEATTTDKIVVWRIYSILLRNLRNFKSQAKCTEVYKYYFISLILIGNPPPRNQLYKSFQKIISLIQIQLYQKGFDTFTLKEERSHKKHKLGKDKRQNSGNSPEEKPWKFFYRMDIICPNDTMLTHQTIIDTMSVNESQDNSFCW